MRAAPRSVRQVAYCAVRGVWPRHGLVLREFDCRAHCPQNEGYSTRPFVLIRAVNSDAAVAVQPSQRGKMDEEGFIDACLTRYEALEDGENVGKLPALLDSGLDVSIDGSDTTVPQSNLARYGKWRHLSLQYHELKRESDISGKIGPPRLVDEPRNVNDIDLWGVILNFRYRQDGFEGVSTIMQALQARRVLWEVEGPSATAFWGTILKEAVLHEDTLLSVWEYAEWLYEAHSVRWPNLYTTVLSSFIDRKDTKRAIQWHLRLSPNYGLETPAFGELLQRFVCNPDPAVQEILLDLYQTSHHRQLYDNIVPYLYSEGRLSLARTWRRQLTWYGDLPASFAARPFLRFMAGYFPREFMDQREHLAGGTQQKASKVVTELVHDEGGGSYRQLINRIHGRTFGIKEKLYNDALGARWFASSWISVDLALDVVRFLGFERIGPLSLQSIALREGHPDRILDRLDQLELSGISIGDSSYAKAVRHFATMDDLETLMDLLYSDIHPDVFDDPAMQREILKLAIRSGKWKQYRLVLSVKLAVSLDTVSLDTNQLVVESLCAGDTQMTIRMLEDMHKRGVQILPSTSNAISMHIIGNLPLHRSEGGASLDHYVALSRLVMASRFPLATQALHILLNNLGNAGRLEELERVSVEILQRYSALRTSTRPTLNIHRLDVPEPVEEEHRYGSFQLVPRELNLRHDLHPVQLLFDKELQHNIIHWGFTARHVSQPLPNSAKTPRQPVDFSFARGIRLLAILRDYGVVFDAEAVTDIRGAVELHLATLFSDAPGKPISNGPRWISQLGLQEAKALCDEAWGSELLRPVSKLKERVDKLDQKLRANRGKSAEGRKWTKLDPRIRIQNSGSGPPNRDLSRYLLKK